MATLCFPVSETDSVSDLLASLDHALGSREGKESIVRDLDHNLPQSEGETVVGGLGGEDQVLTHQNATWIK